MLALPAQLAFLFLDQTIQFVEQFAIAFADRVDDTGEHWFDAICALAQQSVDDVFFDSPIKIVAGDQRGIQKRAAIFAALEQFLFEEPVERGHQGCISDPLVESAVDVAHADFTKTPRLFHHLTFELAESETGDFARPAKSTQKKSRRFHGDGHCLPRT